jgi:hypothetical protein
MYIIELSRRYPMSIGEIVKVMTEDMVANN